MKKNSQSRRPPLGQPARPVKTFYAVEINDQQAARYVIEHCRGDAELAIWRPGVIYLTTDRYTAELVVKHWNTKRMQVGWLENQREEPCRI